MTKSKMPPIAALIGETPGAQTREEALASIEARRARLLSQETPEPPADFTTPEPMPLLDDPDAFAKKFIERIMEKGEPPPRGVKPRVVVDNDNDPKPPDVA